MQRGNVFGPKSKRYTLCSQNEWLERVCKQCKEAAKEMPQNAQPVTSKTQNQIASQDSFIIVDRRPNADPLVLKSP